MGMDIAQAYRKFFEKMARDHPKVLFVVAAGNDSKKRRAAAIGLGVLHCQHDHRGQPGQRRFEVEDQQHERRRLR